MKTNIFFLILFCYLSTMYVMGQTKNADKPGIKDTWNLQEIYPDDQAWNDAKSQFAEKINKVASFKGTLSQSADKLADALQFQSEITKEFYRLYSYASMKSDQDTRVAKYLSMKQEIGQLGTEYSSMASYIEPEILEIDEPKLKKFIEENQNLKVYELYLQDLIRNKEHTLSEKEEKIVAQAGLVTGTPASIFRTFINAEFPFPEVTLENGDKVKLSQSGFSKHRASENRADRKKVFEAYFGSLKKFEQTFGEQLYANIKKDMFYSRVRNYDNSLESALDRNNIPTEVYHSLIDNVNNNLKTFHRYLQLKKRMLDVDTLRYYDLYAPVVKDIEIEYSIDDAKKHLLDAVEPLGKDYQSTLMEAFQNRWIDVYPGEGKRSGAYSSGSVYDVHPYVLLNYNQQYSDVSTLAHEMGHALHSFYSNKNQPFPLASYSIFVAEVASTLNEALLNNDMVENAKNDNVKLSLLMGFLDRFKGTLFRQVQFAEFELKIHEVAEQGKPLTGDKLSEIYYNILSRYYGHEDGICSVDKSNDIEWAYVPHFYYNFYVYQYATSFCASTALAEKILQDDEEATKKYLSLISAGGSDYPIELLKQAGVDMTTSEPFDKTMQAVNRMMDQVEKILDKQGK